MYLYGAKVVEILEAEGARQCLHADAPERASPFYLFAALQSMHPSFPDIPEYADEWRWRATTSSTPSNTYW